MKNLKYTDVEGRTIAYAVFGSGKIDLVVEMGLGACMGEWWHVADKLSEKYTVLLYERAGNGSSDSGKNARTPHHIAMELYGLLSQLSHESKVTILAHSQGGLYAQQFARLFPEMIKGLVLLDPLSAGDNRFRTELSKREYKKSGVNKSGGLYINLILARLHLGGLIKSFMRQAPPFYYFKDFSKNAENYILNCLTQPKVYKTAIEEYEISHREENISQLKTKEGFPQIPIGLITHSSEKEMQEIMQFGGLQYEEAQKIEKIWQSIMQEYLEFSSKSRLWQADNSSHYIHLTDLEMVCEAIDAIWSA